MVTKNNTRVIFEELENLITEQRNPNTETIDTASVDEILAMINTEDSLVHIAVKKEIGAIKEAVDLIVEAFKSGGRLFYIGAGTSGRLGVLDASECPPTFGADPEMVQGVIAGGDTSLRVSQEGVEDDGDRAADDLASRGFGYKDVLCGLSASKRTPYVVGALEHARALGAKTIYVTCAPRANLTVKTDVVISPVVGPEVIMGSTRMKAGTAQKMVLNMLTTASFIRLGKVYKNMMVDLQMKSDKLRERSKRVVMTVTGVDYDTAGRTLKAAGGHVKTAIVMLLQDVSSEIAREKLIDADGFVGKALDIPGTR